MLACYLILDTIPVVSLPCIEALRPCASMAMLLPWKWQFDWSADGRTDDARGRQEGERGPKHRVVCPERHAASVRGDAAASLAGDGRTRLPAACAGERPGQQAEPHHRPAVPSLAAGLWGHRTRICHLGG